MPRAPRTDAGGLVYHMLNRANAHASLFDDEADCRRFTDFLAEERTRAGMRSLAWCPTAGISCSGRASTAISAASSVD